MRRIAACLLVCAAIVIGYFALPASAATASTADGWSGPQAIPGLPAAVATASGGSWPVGISCPSAGDCTAVAQPQTGTPGTDNVYVASQASGTWGDWQAIPGTAALGTLIIGMGVSCPSAGNCTVVGTYYDASDTPQTFAAQETSGSWADATEVPGMTFVADVSCWSPGNCVAAGTVQPAFSNTSAIYPVVATESGGTWTSAQPVAGVSLSSTTATADGTFLSCDSAGNCAAAWNFAVPRFIADVATETGGSWSSAVPIQGITSLSGYDGNGYYATSASCAPAGGCTVAGSYGVTSPASFTVAESAGTWSSAATIPGTATSTSGNVPVEISCAATGDCSAVGPAWTDTETAGAWGTAAPISGLETIDPSLNNLATTGISCGAPGDCSVVGTANGAAFAVDQTGGSWAPAQALNAPGGDYFSGTMIACATATDCATVSAAQVPATAQVPQQDLLFAASRSVTQPTATTTALAVSAPSLVYGDEQGETITATVSGDGISPWGNVAVTSGTAPVCTIFVRAGIGSCTLASTTLPGGTASLVGTYGGNGTLAASASAPATVTVAKDPTTTTLSLSAATAIYGAEKAVRLTATVTPHNAGTPTGTVVVKSGTATVCTITLSGGHGNCSPTAALLAAGAHSLVASYSGSVSFAASASVVGRLTIARATTRTVLTLSASRITYGRETAERLSVTVTPQYPGALSGTVTITATAGRTTTVIARIVLRSGKASYTLTARQLRAGSYTLTAGYGGNTDYAGSTAAKKALTVLS